MTNVTINKDWYNEIKELVNTANPYFYKDWNNREMIEVDVDEEVFNKVSKDLGWML